MPKAASSGATKKEGGKRAQTPFNKFMSAELKRVKAATPGIAHKEAFKKAAQNWHSSSDNPKNKK
ncbi:hypothetical protein BKA69DRAFT_1068831 [Paraphysoderma sedebokerense]|nr:hypothetical protein BKA69DRAFT_1068831 [Paraphysoderma sedebokerense]